MAAAYDAGRGLEPLVVETWRALVTPYLSDLHPWPILDLGAGTGRFSAHLVDWSGGTLVAVEPAAPMARQIATRGSATVDVAVGTAESIPLRDASVGAAWLSQVIHHFRDLDLAACELARVLRPGGRVLIRGSFGRRDPLPVRPPDFVLYRYFPAAERLANTFPTRQRVLEAFGSAGFIEERSTRVWQTTTTSLRSLYERTATRADSTLAALDDDCFAAGLAALERDAHAETTPHPVMDLLDFMVLRTPHRRG